MLKNPTWLTADTVSPQWYKHPTPKPVDKTVVFHCFPGPATGEQMRAAGAGAVWQNNRTTQNIPFAQNYSTVIFESQTPTEAKVREEARKVSLVNGMLITDEFPEGTFPQVNHNQTRSWFYDELLQKAASEGKTIKLRGEYGSGAISVYKQWKQKHNYAPDPMGAYFLSLLQPNVLANFDNEPNPLKSFAQSPEASEWGRVVSYYESIERDSRLVLSNIPFQAILQYNVLPDCPTMLFTWPKMQSNGHQVDVPQRDSGTIRQNGTVGIDFPHRSPEISKILAFFALLLYEDAYLWNDYGTPPDDETSAALKTPAISTDAFKVGIDWYTELISSLNNAGRELLACNYSGNGVNFGYSGEKRISRLGHAYYNNSYFNKAAAEQKGFLIEIPSTQPRFIWLDAWNSPLVKTRVIAQTSRGQSIDLGEIPGMTLYVG